MPAWCRRPGTRVMRDAARRLRVATPEAPRAAAGRDARAAAGASGVRHSGVLGGLTSPGPVAAVVVAALIAFHLAVHQDEGGWVGKASWPGTTTLDGHLVEWEWLHVAETVVVIDADQPPPDSIQS